MADVTLVLWRDIPAQVLQGKGRGAVRITLDERFEQAIDRAAMKAGLSGTDDYLGEWRRETVQAEDVQALATRIETEYDTARLRDLIASGGRKD
ncbi:virulence factor [Paracoccus sp. (in: a-proteobacteria)]|uniref:virulence factor n=1 Tax=Paracoccus sp. TaxID=267 RepID=UPI00405A1AE2